MKKIVNGLTYNTDAADHVCDVSNAYGRQDFKCVRANLYRTKKGRFFIAGWGGAMSIFARDSGDGGICGGEGVIPLTAEEALRHAEQHAEPEVIEEFFSDLIEEA